MSEKISLDSSDFSDYFLFTRAPLWHVSFSAYSEQWF